MRVKPIANQILLFQGVFDVNINLSVANIWYAQENYYNPNEMLVTRKDNTLVLHLTKEQFNKYFKEV